jgi:hypothetical protein
VPGRRRSQNSIQAYPSNSSNHGYEYPRREFGEIPGRREEGYAIRTGKVAVVVTNRSSNLRRESFCQLSIDQGQPCTPLGDRRGTLPGR